MNVICWNVQGLGSPGTFPALWDLTHKFKPQILFLSETKSQERRIRSLQYQLKFFDSISCDKEGKSGGIALLWIEQIKVTELSRTQHHIDVVVEEEDKPVWRFTGFYGHPNPSQRHHSWELLKRIKSMSHLPWLVGGDLNEILYNSEKKGGVARNPRAMLEFQLALSICGLRDLGWSGYQYTWSNRQDHDHLVEVRLDRFLCSYSWENSFNNSRVTNVTTTGSDHSPILMEMGCIDHQADFQKRWGRRFHFEEFWSKYDDCKTEIMKSWTNGRASEINISNCRGVLKEWSTEKFSGYKRLISDLQQTLEALKKCQRTEENVRQMRNVEKELTNVMAEQETYWRVRSRVSWLKEGDKNTKFFHSKASRRRKNNIIRRILVDGQWLTEPNQVEDEICSYFTDIYSSSHPSETNISAVLNSVNQKVTPRHNMLLSGPYTATEITAALKQFHPSKAPGPDGFPAFFFQRYWPEVGEDVLRTTLDILNNNRQIGILNHTHLALIPKIKHPAQTNQYKPISLCNVVYKLVAKVLANRLKGILNDIISQNQSAFIPGRLISDNAILGYESMHKIRTQKKGKVGLCAYKLDMAKAYDRVEWMFLEKMMRKLGFCEVWISRVMNCITGATFSVIINGAAKEMIHPQRGLRQGCPLSPYLFLLCSEALSCLINDAEQRNLIQGLKVSRYAPSISHLLFADDCLIFTKASKQEAGHLKDILNAYEKASGQCINFHKSKLSCSPNIHTMTQGEIRDLMGIELVPQHDTYLGLPSSLARTKKEVFKFLVDKVAKKVGGWREKMFSTGGKEILIKAVTQVVPTYAMGIFKIPVGTAEDINRIIAQFWWGGNEEKRKMHWVSWKKMCQPKGRGGMGFRDIEAFNQSLLAKQAWRIQNNPKTLLSRVMKARYFPRCAFMESPTGNKPSYVWRSIIWGRELLRQGCYWRVGCGETLRVYKDQWIPRPNLFKPYSPNTLHPETTVAELKTTAGGWNTELIEQSFMATDAEAILSIPLSRRAVPDSLAWYYDPKGKFTVSSAYRLAISLKDEVLSTTSEDNKNMWDSLWNLRVPNKVKIFLWRAMHNTLATADGLAHRSIIDASICSRCKMGNESTDHAILSCPKAYAVWKQTHFFTKLPKLKQVSFKDLFMAINENMSKEDMVTFSLTAWSVWYSRNRFVFEGERIGPRDTVNWVQRFRDQLNEIEEHREINEEREDREQRNITWVPLIRDRFKLNVDATVKKELNRFGLGSIIRDSRGQVMAAAAINRRGSPSVVEAEALAVLEGINLARDLGFFEIMAETDSMVVAGLLKGNDNALSGVGHLIEDILQFQFDFRFLSFDYCPRACNVPANGLAKHGLHVGSDRYWIEDCPSFISKDVMVDLLSD